MSVLIKDIEMPTGRGALTLKVWPSGRVEIINEAGEWKTSEAVPIPQHGKLIDADKMKESIRKQTSFLRLIGSVKLAEIAETLEKGFIQEIDNAPTIIPAEETT